MKNILIFFSIFIIFIFTGCTAKRPISLSPSIDYNKLVLNDKFDSSAGLFIPNELLNQKVEKSTGSDSVTYYPYRDIKPVILKALSASFKKVKLTNKENSLDTDYNFVPELKTEVTEKSSLYWPPKAFKLEMDLKIFKKGEYLTTLKTKGIGESLANEFVTDFNYSPKKATENAIFDLQSKLQTNEFFEKVEKYSKEQKVIYKEKIVKVGSEYNNKEKIKEEYSNNIKKEYNFISSSNKNMDSFALVIGINQYKQNTSVEYADLSALAFEELAIKTLGIPKENVITLLNDDATSGQLKAKIELIKELADSNGNLYVYFAGHGVPGKDGNTYILPNDMSADSIHLEPNLQLNNIYSKLSKSNAKNVFVFMDSCFSGKDDKGELLYKGVAPILKRNKENSIDSKLTVITAGGANDFANDYEDKKQRLFSYYLIQELSQGKTDLNEVYSNIKNDIKRTSLMKGIGYKQVPQISGSFFDLY